MQDDNKTGKDERRDSWLATWARIGYIGILFPVSILLGYYIGSWLDNKFSTKPYLTIVMIMLGFIAALKNLIMEVNRLDEKSDKNSDDR